MTKIYKIIKKIIVYAFLISCILIMVYEIVVLRSFGKALIQLIQKLFCIRFDIIGLVSTHYVYIERICAWIIILCALLCMYMSMAVCIKTLMTEKAEGRDAFETSLLRYLNHSKECKCYMISGYWGSGKTYMLNSFLDQYYRNTRFSVYWISCFGLTNRTDVVNEINKAIEHEDDSLRKKLVVLLGQLPVIGGFLGEVLKRNYNYLSVRDKSIFVFDDLERIGTYESEPVRNNRQSTFVNNGQDSISADLAMINIHKRLEEMTVKMDYVIESIDNRNRIIKQSDEEKYLAIAGIVNELIERFKVIIICNKDMISRTVFDNTIKAKLNCIVYHKQTEPSAGITLANRIVDNTIVESKKKEKCIKEYIGKMDVGRILSVMRSSNLRAFSNVCEAFLATVLLFDEDDLEKDSFLDSVLSSVLVAHSKVYRNLKIIPRGCNISYFDSSYDLSPTGNSRWIGYEFANFWLLNLDTPQDVKSCVRNWMEYPYVDLEKRLFNGDLDAIESYDFDIIHLCFYINSNQFTLQNIDYTNLLNRYIEKNGKLDSESLRHILVSFSSYLDFYSGEVSVPLFELLYKRSGGIKCEGNNYWVQHYNEYLEQRYQIERK